MTSNDGTLDGVTLAVDSTLQQGAQVTVLKDLILDNATLTLQRLTTSSNVEFDTGLNFSDVDQPNQTLGGSGEVVLQQSGDGNVPSRLLRVHSTVGSLTIGENVTVRSTSDSRFVTLGGVFPLIIEGTVSSQATSSPPTLLVTGSTVTNNGTLESRTGTLDVDNLIGNLGQTSINGGDLLVSGSFSVDQPVTINGGLDLDGSYTIDQPVSLLSGRLTLSGDWDNESTIDQGAGTINLGGVFTVDDLGATVPTNFTGSGGTVNIIGTLSAGVNSVLLINSERTWQLNGGTIQDVTIDDDNNGGAPATLQVTSNDGALDGVILGVDTTMVTGAVVTVTNDLILDDVTLRLSRAGNINTPDDIDLRFSGGSQTLGGVGVVELLNSFGVNALERYLRIRPADGADLLIDSGITVQNDPSSVFYNIGGSQPADHDCRNCDRPEGQASNNSLRVTGSSVTNNGLLESLTGTLDVDNLIGNLGQTLIDGGDLLVSGSFSVDQPVTINGGLDLDGSYTIDQPVSLLSGRLTLSGDWDNERTIDQDAGTINWGGGLRWMILVPRSRRTLPAAAGPSTSSVRSVPV